MTPTSILAFCIFLLSMILIRKFVFKKDARYEALLKTSRHSKNRKKRFLAGMSLKQYAVPYYFVFAVYLLAVWPVITHYMGLTRVQALEIAIFTIVVYTIVNFLKGKIETYKAKGEKQ